MFAALTVFVLSRVGEHRKMERLITTDTLMLGTSLMRFAVPDPQAQSLPPSVVGPHALRLGFSRGSEERLLHFATIGAKAGVPRIILEVNPIVARFADQPSSCGVAGRAAEKWRTTRQSTRRLVMGRSVFGDAATGVDTYPTGALVQANIARLYPLQVLGPCYLEAWQDLVSRHPDTQFIFVVMPRRDVAYEAIGKKAMAAFDAASRSFAEATGAALFVVDPAHKWQTQFFAGQAHLSPAGAEKFQTDLIHWIERRQ